MPRYFDEGNDDLGLEETREEQLADLEDEGDGWDNPIEQGMYDDDPSPYDGTYSEE